MSPPHCATLFQNTLSSSPSPKIAFSPFRKVTLLEDRESVIHLRNLSLHPANDEEEGENHHVS